MEKHFDNTIRSLVVPLYIIILIVAIPQLSETIYAPALPALARHFDVSAGVAEFTFTIYLLGFGLGTLVWGSISDRIGRKPALIMGFMLYIVANIICYSAPSINTFMNGRFLQAIGACVGSVLGQAVARDAIKPEERGKLFSSVSMAMAFAPAIGPVFGGLTMKYGPWYNVFLVLTVVGVAAIAMIIAKLPETRPPMAEKPKLLKTYKECFLQMIQDKRVIGFGFLVGSVNGILFGYFQESPFYFIEALGINAQTFSMLAFYICIPLALGGWISKRMHAKGVDSDHIITRALMIMVGAALAFVAMTQLHLISISDPFITSIVSLLMIGIVMMCVTMIIPNCLSQALQDYGRFTGTAASLFGFYYYCVVAGMTALMGIMHDGSLYALPLFFLIQSTLMSSIFYYFIVNNK